MTQPAIAYTCIISEYNLPELEACLRFRPANIVLIASDRFIEAAQQLELLLKEKLPDSQLHLLSKDSTGETLHGDRIDQNLAWLQQHLLPRLQQFEQQGQHNIANVTGGTKAMTLALSNCHQWHRLDYQSFDSTLQSVRAQDGAFEPVPAGNEAPPAIRPLDIARLHNRTAKEEKANPLLNLVPSLPLAKSIWQAQNQDDGALRRLLAGFERVWAYERDHHQSHTISLPWCDFFAKEDASPVPDATALRWLEQFRQLQGDTSPLRWDEQQITLPGNKPKKHSKHLRHWLSGDWLEQLAHDWLLTKGIPPEVIARNITGAPLEGNSNSQRETDLMVHHQRVTSLIEVKAGLPPGKEPGELENQLSSLGSRFGRTRKALLLGPQLLKDLCKRQKSEAFWYRCEANNITLILNQQHLADFVTKQPVWRDLPRHTVPVEFHSAP